MDSRAWKLNSRTWGDAAVDGLLAGVVAGLLMALFLTGTGMLRGLSWAALLGQFDPEQGTRPAIGLVTHLAVAGVYGAVFGVIWRLSARLAPSLPAWVAGFLFGLGLWLVALGVTAARGPAAAGGWLSGIPSLEFAIGHGLYGLALGWLSARMHRRVQMPA